MQEKYGAFCDLFETAERHIKECETIEFEPCIPAINQLRYAACHLKRSFQQTDPIKEGECIKSAERHCQRAIKDVTEASIDYVTAWVYEFELGFAYIPISDEIKDHHELKINLKAAMDFVTSYNHDETEISTDKLENYMRETLKIMRRYEAGRDGLNKRARTARLKFVGALSASIISISVLIVSILNFLK